MDKRVSEVMGNTIGKKISDGKLISAEDKKASNSNSGTLFYDCNTERDLTKAFSKHMYIIDKIENLTEEERASRTFRLRSMYEQELSRVAQ